MAMESLMEVHIKEACFFIDSFHIKIVKNPIQIVNNNKTSNQSIGTSYNIH